MPRSRSSSRVSSPVSNRPTPHSWLWVDVKGSDGTVISWAVEFGAPYSLLQKGLRKTDFPIGAEVVVQAFLRQDRQGPWPMLQRRKFPDGPKPSTPRRPPTARTHGSHGESHLIGGDRVDPWGWWPAACLAPG